MSAQVALVGDYDAKVTAHQAIPQALALADATLTWEWLPTEKALHADLSAYDAFWCVPASPYRSMDGALRAIRFARESQRPYLGTCGGCQHAILEFARDVLGMREAAHAEADPGAAELVVSRLSCSLVEASETLRLAAGSRLREIYGADEIRETYRCNFGLNSAYIDALVSGGLRIGATAANGEVRAMELPSHPFFFVTLFQPERSALRRERHPLIAAFTAAAGGARARAKSA